MTKTQVQLLKFIARHIDQYGFQPSYREISEHFDWRSTNAVRNHMLILEKAGAILMTGESRAIHFNWRQWLETNR